MCRQLALFFLYAGATGANKGNCMLHYKNATMETWSFGADAVKSRQCEVCIADDGKIEVTYRSSADETGYTVYEGKELDEGHYLLECESPVCGRATLHRFPDSLILEGYWDEVDDRGMRRITLGEVSDVVTGANASESVGLAATTSLDSLDLPADDEDEDWHSTYRRYRFPLRNDCDVYLRLPDDLTQREGRRLAAFIKSLAYFEH